MAVPKRKTSTSKRNMRRAHDGLSKLNILTNKTSGELQLPHQVSVDGYYKGKKVIQDKVKKEKTSETPEGAAPQAQASKAEVSKEKAKKSAK